MLCRDFVCQQKSDSRWYEFLVYIASMIWGKYRFNCLKLFMSCVCSRSTVQDIYVLMQFVWGQQGIDAMALLGTWQNLIMQRQLFLVCVGADLVERPPESWDLRVKCCEIPESCLILRSQDIGGFNDSHKGHHRPSMFTGYLFLRVLSLRSQVLSFVQKHSEMTIGPPGSSFHGNLWFCSAWIRCSAMPCFDLWFWRLFVMPWRLCAGSSVLYVTRTP